MSENDTLQQAYQLIRSGEKTEAVKLLLPIVRADPDNADAWWLLANAVDKSDQAKRALQQVLKIRPNDQRARRFLEQLGGTPPPSRMPPPTTFDEEASFTTSGAPPVYRDDSADDGAPTAEQDVWANAFAANDADAPSQLPAQPRAVDPDLNFDEDPLAPDKPTVPLPPRRPAPPAGGQRRSPSSLQPAGRGRERAQASRPPARAQPSTRAGRVRRPEQKPQRRQSARPPAPLKVEEFAEDPFAPNSTALTPRRSLGEQIVTILIAVLLLALLILAVVLILNNSVGSTS
jgi:hypothetical protein